MLFLPHNFLSKQKSICLLSAWSLWAWVISSSCWNIDSSAVDSLWDSREFLFTVHWQSMDKGMLCFFVLFRDLLSVEMQDTTRWLFCFFVLFWKKVSDNSGYNPQHAYLKIQNLEITIGLFEKNLTQWQCNSSSLVCVFRYGCQSCHAPLLKDWLPQFKGFRVSLWTTEYERDLTHRPDIPESPPAWTALKSNFPGRSDKFSMSFLLSDRSNVTNP